MQIVIKCNQFIYFQDILPIQEEAFFKYFSAELPGRHYIDTDQMLFSGVFRKYNLSYHRMDRAFLKEVTEFCDNKGWQYTIEDRREPSKYPVIESKDVNNDFIAGITLEEHQVRSIRAGIDNEIGLIELPTGAGKTEVAAGLCLACNCPTVILADMTIVVEQIKKRLELRKVAEEVGVFFAGKTPKDQTVIVGTIQSLNIPKPPATPTRKPEETETAFQKRREKYQKYALAYKSRVKRAKQLRKLVQNCELLIVDEADKATNKLWSGLFRFWFKGRRRIGLSGTTFDDAKPVENLHLREHLGSIIASEGREKLIELGRIEPVDIYFITIGDKSQKSSKSACDIAVNEEIIHNVEFHNTIAEICRKLPPDEGRMILVDRDHLGLALEKLIPNSKFIHGKTPKPKRGKIISEFERREFNTLIGGKICFRGLDMAGGVENLIIATGGQLNSDFNQKVGRAVRQNKNGLGRVYDFYFLTNHYLYSHSRKRLVSAIKIARKVKVIYKGNVIDGEKLVRSRYRLP